MQTDTIVIPSRFCGPQRSGNGGYVCGRLANYLPGSVCVQLKAPSPLEVEMRVESRETGAQLFYESTLVAEARPFEVDLVPPGAPSYAEAEEASKFFVGFADHPFPRCFVCGPQRLPADGMRIFPGLIDARSLVAAPWIPDPSLANRAQQIESVFIWSALDCTGGIALCPVPEGKAIVLGELCVRIDGTVAPGERCVVIGWSLGGEGRKRTAGSALYSEAGKPVAVASAIWIEVPRSTFPDQ